MPELGASVQGPVVDGDGGLKQQTSARETWMRAGVGIYGAYISRNVLPQNRSAAGWHYSRESIGDGRIHAQSLV